MIKVTKVTTPMSRLISEYKTVRKEVSKRMASWQCDNSFPLSERWNLFCTLNLGHQVWGVSGFETIGGSEYEDNFDVPNFACFPPIALLEVFDMEVPEYLEHMYDDYDDLEIAFIEEIMELNISRVST